ncbi:MAG: hypothetical protein ACOVQE_00025 [Chitinophagaceae bacterium]
MAKFLLIGLFVAIVQFVQAQNPLPEFTVKYAGNSKVQISWRNNFTDCIQLAVQRSFDSSGFFKTIYLAQSPTLPQNGFIDNNMPRDLKVYYRIFYVLKNGSYYFTKIKPPSDEEKTELIQPDIVTVTEKTIDKVIANKAAAPTTKNTVVPEKKEELITIFFKNTKNPFKELTISMAKKWADSIFTKTKDTLKIISNEEWLLIPFVPKPVWKPSVRLFSGKNNQVVLRIPDFKQHHYSVVIYQANGNVLFKINMVEYPELKLDKAIFLKSGWYDFEIYQNSELLERNKFYLEPLW